MDYVRTRTRADNLGSPGPRGGFSKLRQLARSFISFTVTVRPEGRTSSDLALGNGMENISNPPFPDVLPLPILSCSRFFEAAIQGSGRG